ncbi:LysR family transcriptional regulator [Ancylobacter defluvii]|nr:LysR family transcriptional regulator [Ancylobacter defluvii]
MAQRLDPFLLKHWRFILAAAEEGSFRRAADRLGVQQSTLSRRIRDIEDAMGATLFARSHAGVRPTFAGRRLLGPAREILAHWRWSAPEPRRMACFASVSPDHAGSTPHAAASPIPAGLSARPCRTRRCGSGVAVSGSAPA